MIPILLLAAAPLPAFAQTPPPAPAKEGLDLSADVRIRYESLDGQARAGFGPSDELFSIRTIIGVTWRRGDVTLGGELYDSRAYGSEPGSAIGTGEINTVEPVQAWAALDLGPVLGKGSRARVQAGRFTLNLGSRRLVAADDYRNTTNGYTGLRADLGSAGGVSATLFYVLPQSRLPDDRAGIRAQRVVLDRESFDVQLWGIVAARTRTIAGATAELTYVGFAERDAPGRPTRDRRLHTFGGRLIRDPARGKFDVEVEAFYQTGTASTGLTASAPRRDVSASFVHADIGYSFATPWKPRLSVEYDRASGDGRGQTIGRFDTLFGMRRADLAPAGIYAQIGRANISTPGVRIEVQPSQRFDGFVTARGLWLASATDSFSTTGVRDASGASGSFAGYQVEGRARRWLIPKRLRLEVNGALLLKRGVLVDAPNAAPGRSVRYIAVATTASF